MKGLGFMLFLVGGVFLIVSGYLFFDHWQFMSRAKETTAEVVEIQVVKGDEADSYIPVLKYKTDANLEVISHPNVTLSPPYHDHDFKKGDKISIRYDPNHPYRIFLKSFFEN